MPLASVIRRLRDLALAVRIAVAIVCVRVALALLPYRIVEGWMSRGRTPPAINSAEVSRVLRIVPKVSRLLLPEKPCLTQALVARRMLRNRGVETDLKIGVTRSSREDLRAHAWLERDGHVLVGRIESLEEYSRLEPLGRS